MTACAKHGTLNHSTVTNLCVVVHNSKHLSLSVSVSVHLTYASVGVWNCYRRLLINICSAYIVITNDNMHTGECDRPGITTKANAAVGDLVSVNETPATGQWRSIDL